MAAAAAGSMAVAVFVGFVAPRERAAALGQWGARLSAMADDREASVDRWLSEGLADADLVGGYPTTMDVLAGGRVERPEAAGSGRAAHLRGVLEEFIRHKRYSGVWVVDRSGGVVAEEPRPEPGRGTPACLATALDLGSPRVDIDRPAGEGPRVCFASVVPHGATGSGAIMGAVVLQADPAEWLFPRLAREPVPTRSAETLLVRREGARIRFLSPLRHDPAPALTLTRPALSLNLAADAAVAGPARLGDFTDYRGVPILAATRRLERAGWGLVVKVDREEALADAETELRETAAMWSSVFLAVLGLGYGLWRRQRTAFDLALMRQEAWLGVALRQANDVVLLIDLKGNIIEARGAVEALYACAAKDLRGTNIASLWASPDPKAAQEFGNRIRRSGGLVVEREHRRRDGSVFPVEVSVRLVQLDGAEVFLAIHRDITERKRHEARLGTLSRAVEQSPVSVVITDAAGAIEYVNPKFTHVTGYTPDEVLGRNPSILKSGQTPPEVYQDLWRSITAGREWRGELQNRKKDGSLFWEEASISPILDEEGQASHYVAVKEDITERKLAEARLEATQQQLFQAQKMEAIGQLAGGVAHDFNNLLGVITGYGEMLGRGLGLGTKEYERLDQILRAADRAADLTRQLLAFSRRQVLNPKLVDLNAVLGDVQKMLRRLIGENIELELRCSPDLRSVKVDPGQMEQVVLNLAVNARDAMPRGGSLTLATADVELDAAGAARQLGAAAGSWVTLAVSDTGHGMDDETRLRVFEPFFTTKPAGQGTGLGLSTVYGIVKQSGGFVIVDSAPGRGTTFTVYLPPAEGLPALRQAPVSAVLPRGSETILVVEDQELLRELVCETLAGLGYDVLSAASGPEAVRLVEGRAGGVDLLLTDVVLPGLSGKDLAERLVARMPGLRTLFMSGYTADIIAHHGVLEAGIQFLQKPFTGEKLARRVREVIEGAPPEAT